MALLNKRIDFIQIMKALSLRARASVRARGEGQASLWTRFGLIYPDFSTVPPLCRLALMCTHTHTHNQDDRFSWIHTHARTHKGQCLHSRPGTVTLRKPF